MYCKDCTYYACQGKDYYWGDHGQCRFNPAVYCDKGNVSIFPKVKATSWCGKFKERQ